MFKVQVRGPNGFVVEFSVEKESISLGRDPESDIYLPSSLASRNHARAFIKNDQVFIEDFTSSNGTFIRNEKVTTPMPITADDPVKLGDVYVRIEYQGKVKSPMTESGGYSIAQRLGNRQSTVQVTRADEAKIRDMLRTNSGPFKTVK